MIWSYHHILMDGWGLGQIYNNLFEIYGGLQKGESVRLEPAVPYANYIKWLDRQDTDEGLNYWKKYLEGYNRQAHLPVFNPWRIGNKYELEEFVKNRGKIPGNPPYGVSSNMGNITTTIQQYKRRGFWYSCIGKTSWNRRNRKYDRVVYQYCSSENKNRTGSKFLPGT
jgi:hypothetical protein